jgi:hypothetical protein
MKAILLGLALAWSAVAEDQAKIFELKYGDVRRIGETIRIFPNSGLLWDESMRTISVKGTAEQLKVIEEAIQRFDVPSATQNLEFTIYLVIASPDPGKGGGMPQALDSVVKQMSETFSFKSFRMGETFLIRSRDGRMAEASSIGPYTGDGQNTIYQCKFNSARLIPDEKGKKFRIDGLRIGMKMPYKTSGGADPKYQYADIGFNTDIDVREGQKAVVGKANVIGGETMFAVLVPRIVD